MVGTPWEVPVPRNVVENEIAMRAYGWRLFFIFAGWIFISIPEILFNSNTRENFARQPKCEMLTTLGEKNLSLVEDLTLEFQACLNVISGETGAGKSILIGALSLVLGERADPEPIRTGADGCAVEAVFNVRGLGDELGLLLEENGLEPCAGEGSEEHT